MPDVNDPDDDLWFLPGPADDADEPDTSLGLPWVRAPRGPDLGPSAWRAAEGGEYRALLDAVEPAARLAGLLRAAPDGVAERLALGTVSALLAAEGVWLGPERIALYRALRLASLPETRDLARAARAVRVLLDGVGQDRLRPQDDMAATLHLDWDEALASLSDCHRLTRAAFGFWHWRQLGLGRWEDILEPAVTALRLAAPKGASFLPLAGGARLDRHALTAGQGAGPRLAGFCAALRAGAEAACHEIDRLRAWQDRASAATADLQGRTPPLLIAALLRHPVLPADLAAQVTGATPLTLRRNLTVFEDRGLVRELTGQARFRFWSAAL